MRRRACAGRPALAALLALGLAVAGCGAGAPAHLSSSQLRDRAGAICTTASQAADAIPTPSFTGMPRFLDRGLAVLTPELAALRLLRPSGQAGAVYRQALDSFDAELRALDGARAALRGGADPILTTQRLQHALAGPEASARRAWQALEIPSCLA